MQFIRDAVLRDPILVVSPWFEARRTEYQDGLLQLSQMGDWNAWVGFFADGVEASADTTRIRVERLLAWREQALDRVRVAGVAGLAGRVAEELIAAPIVRAGTIARRHDVTRQGARSALIKLVDLELLRREPHGGQVRFVAEDVLDLLKT